MIPQSFEAGPSPETSRAIGGRCCPHSKNPSYLRPRPSRDQQIQFFSGAFRGSGDVTRYRRLGQLTKRRSRTFITRPIARKTNNVEEHPSLINGRGMPITRLATKTIDKFTT